MAFALVAAAIVLVPRQTDGAFGRDQAAAALLPKGVLLHTKTTMVDEGATEQLGPNPTQRLTAEEWVDVERTVSRTEVREPDGKLVEMTVRAGDRSRTYAVEGLLGKNGRLVPEREVVVESSARGIPITSPLVDQLRLWLASGEARVAERKTIDGEEYWVVERDQPSEGVREKDVFRATLRVSDYRLKQIEQTFHGKNGNGRVWGRVTVDFTTWETMPRGGVASDFFSLDAPLKTAPAGTRIEQR
jgi:hypothetical protein